MNNNIFMISRFKNIVAAIVVTLACIIPAQANAYNEYDLNSALKGIKEDKQVLFNSQYEKDQIVIIKTQVIRYIIDIRTETCFVAGLKGFNFESFSCEKIKKGYPEYAPLMRW